MRGKGYSSGNVASGFSFLICDRVFFLICDFYRPGCGNRKSLITNRKVLGLKGGAAAGLRLPLAERDCPGMIGLTTCRAGRDECRGGRRECRAYLSVRPCDRCAG